MMNGLRQNDHFYDNNAGSQRGNAHQTQTLHRRPSRHFDAFSYQQDGLNGPDGMSSQRYDAPRYDRMNPSMQNNYNGYDMSMPQAWNSNGYSHNTALAASGATIRMKPSANRGRPGIPSMWMDQTQNLPTSNGFPSLGNSNMGPPMLRQEHSSLDNEEDLIPTAIVIKNIPFAVKKEQLLQVMTDMCLPLPYAFNYHFDNGVFRGLAFANFTTAEETAAVIQSMNHLELHGRKLRVEYKKMLPQAERDRIEREKRERRGQLEEQHRPVATSQLQTRPSISSLSTGLRAVSPAPPTPRNAQSNLDMNDPTTLMYYSQLIVFNNDATQEQIRFPAHLPPHDRRVIHGLAHQLGLAHESQGVDDQRQVCVYKTGLLGLSPSLPQTGFGLDPNRRGLYRAATTDFTDTRDPSFFNTLARQSSGYLFAENQQNDHAAGNNLRAAKSFADLRSYSPSPSLTNSHFPANLTANIARFTDYNPNGLTNSRSNLQAGTPSSSTGADTLVSSLNNMTIGSGFPNRQDSPQRIRNMISWERDAVQAQPPQQSGAPGPIGGHRSLSTSVDDQSRARNGAPSRQPRGPTLDRGTGFSRGRQTGHQTHGSDELPSHNGVETVIE